MRNKRAFELLIVIAVVAIFGVVRFRGLASSGAAFAASPAPTKGLLLHLPLDGNAEDSSSFHHDTFAEGVTPSTDRHGQNGGACQFPEGSYISVSDPESFNDLKEFTLSAWVKPLQLREHLNVVSKVTPHRDFNLQVDRFGQVASHIMHGRYEFCYTKERLKPGQWYLLVATYSDHTWKIYIDGKLRGEDAVENAPPWTSEFLTVGNIFPKGPEAFLGSLDDLRIYNRALSPSEIEAMTKS